VKRLDGPVIIAILGKSTLMGIREDREDFNQSGLRGLLRRLMTEKDEAFVRILEGGWRGEEASERPAPGTGPYLHYRKGYAVIQYSNASIGDEGFKEFRVEV
jgi:hypothetical protein